MQAPIEVHPVCNHGLVGMVIRATPHVKREVNSDGSCVFFLFNHTRVRPM